MSNDAIVYSAEPLADLSEGLTPGLYEAALYPFDTPAQRRQMALVQESCGLTCEAILRAAEVDGRMKAHGGKDWLRVPYASRIGTTVAYQRELGQERGCWTDATRFKASDPLPVAGHMLELAGPVHVLTVVGVDDTGLVLTTIEGGQHDSKTSHSTAILRKTRRLSIRGGRLYADNRIVTGWLRAGDLPCVPEVSP